MSKEHLELLEKLKRELIDDKRYLSLIICGSVARGTEREDSDVDLCLIATDDEFEKVKSTKSFYFGNDGVFKDDIEIDGKIVPLSYFQSAIERDDEASRELFRGARILFDHSGKVESLIKEVLVYPEEKVDQKLRKFYSLFECNQYYATQALKLDNEYLKIRCLAETVYYASRLILTHNRLFFPCHKSLPEFVERAENKPEGFQELSDKLLVEPTEDLLWNYFEMVNNYFSFLNMDEAEVVGLILDDEYPL